MRAVLAALLLGLSGTALAQQAAPASGPVLSESYRTTYIRLAQRDSEALLYEPIAANAKSHIALLYAHPNGNSFTEVIAAEMASRGYRMLMVNFHGNDESDDAYLRGMSQGVEYLRSLAGVDRVVIVGHSGGGHLAAFYQNVAEHGPSACRGPEKLYPCRLEMVRSIGKADGLALLDPTLGAFHEMSSIDPAAGGVARDPALDMFAAANGYDPAARRAAYSAGFRKRFTTAQGARSLALIERARARLQAIDAGTGQFSDDEPFVVSGMGVTSSGARLYQPDTSILSHTRGSYPLVRTDGNVTTGVIPSIRPPLGQQGATQLRALSAMNRNTTVRRFLASSAIRTTDDYAITEDDIIGVDWKSAFTSTPGNAEGVTVPTMVLSMSCHYLLVSGEIIFDHLAARDKSFAAVEGATHVFAPCKPEYGDTRARVFDYLDVWLSKPGRF